jgi:hypothetical protein
VIETPFSLGVSRNAQYRSSPNLHVLKQSLRWESGWQLLCGSGSADARIPTQSYDRCPRCQAAARRWFAVQHIPPWEETDLDWFIDRQPAERPKRTRARAKVSLGN